MSELNIEEILKKDPREYLEGSGLPALEKIWEILTQEDNRRIATDYFKVNRTIWRAACQDLLEKYKDLESIFSKDDKDVIDRLVDQRENMKKLSTMLSSVDPEDLPDVLKSIGFNLQKIGNLARWTDLLKTIEHYRAVEVIKMISSRESLTLSQTISSSSYAIEIKKYCCPTRELFDLRECLELYSIDSIMQMQLRAVTLIQSTPGFIRPMLTGLLKKMKLELISAEAYTAYRQRFIDFTQKERSDIYGTPTLQQ